MQAPKVRGSIQGGDATVKKVRTFAERLDAELRKTVLKMGLEVEALAKQNVQRLFTKNPHGNLLGNINTRLEETAGSITASVGVSVKVIPGARIHEFGGTILPVKAKLLTWVDLSGERIFAHRVQMPERSYLRTALGAYAPNVEKHVQATINRVAKASGLSTK